MKENMKKIASTLVLTFIFLIAGIIFSNKVEAWMPPTLIRQNPTTGIFPQVYLAERTIVLPGERFNLETKQWTANITGGYIHCGDLTAAIRTGKFDTKTYYAQNNGIGLYIPDLVESIKLTLHREGAHNESFSSYVTGDINQNEIVLETYFAPADPEYWKALARLTMQQVMGILSGQEKIPPYSSDIDPVKVYGEWDGDPNLGPKVGVMETSDGANDGYGKVISSGTYASSLGGGVDSQVAYVLTILEDAYGDGSLGEKYTREDMQTAFWMLVDPDGKESLDPTHLTANGKVLYEKSVEYSNFLQEINGGYNVTVDAEDAQVIANQSTKEYIVGPFKATYPDYEDISYMKSMYITNGTKKLIVDEEHDDFEIICKGGSTAVPGSNGISKIYPKSGEYFFVKFSATDLDNPTQVELHVNCEYLASCSINYDRYEAVCNIYQYIGYTDLDGEYAMKHGSLHITRTWEEWEVVGTDTHHTYDERCVIGDHSNCYSDKYGWVRHQETTDAPLHQPYVKMKEEKVDSTKGQPLPATTGGERIYKVVDATTTVSVKNPEGPDVPPPTIDLTFSLGGTVWVDSQGGKETLGDSNYGSGDVPMSGVPVTLYNSNGAVVATTVTDANGNYKFTGLNAMYKYYVKFTYNSQYYEPVEYVAPYGGNWTTNSNGTDVRSERETVNARFATIGSTPANYTGKNGVNKSYTRDELVAAGAIDQFGNLTGGDSSMQQFVRDCQLDSVTGNGGIDLYPLENIFVIDRMQNMLSRTIVDATPLYPKLLYINQGYTARQEVDLALKKDVEKATLEINGKTHVYQYNQRENVSQDEYERTWDIEARISDAYYDTRYSRELFKSDYAYKVSNYGDNPSYYGKDLDDELKVFITYKLTVRNQSMSIQGRINEIVDYFDEDYTFIPERSSIYTQVGDVRTIIHNNKQDGSSIFKENETIYPGGKATIQGYKNLYVTGLGPGTKATQRTYYYDSNGQQQWTDKEVELNDGVYLKAGQTAYIYLTFEVNKKDNWLILDETVDQAATPIGVGKENIAEINGYSTRYAGGTQVANVGDVGGLAAGLVDKDSNPGNVEYTGIKKDMSEADAKAVYEKFEDDTDKAPNLRLILYKDDSENRVITGAVWEDERNKVNGAATVGDGIRNNETPINGVTVQLVELMDNGTEFIWRTFENGSGTASTTSPIINVNNLVLDHNIGETGTGKYAFKSFMPGNYIVRYIYGDTVKTVLVNDSSSSEEAKNISNVYGEKGLNAKSYNGQDYKSTTYQAGLGTYDGNNTHASYVYDIAKADTASNVSDAKDLKESRDQVIDYSDDNVMNHIAEVLASDREQPTYNGTKYNQTQVQSLVNELIDRTKMTAETGKINIELEYNRDSTGDNKENNKTSYAINNIDLGLEERPKAQLAIDKQVTNVKLTLADGSVLFDAKQTASNVLWQDHKKYDTGYNGNFMDPSKFGTISNIRQQHASKFGLIQLSMDEELMHGATIKITYQITVTNVGEVDYRDDNFYYTGQVSNTNTIVTTTANQLVDYVANNLQFYVADNSSWEVIKADKLVSDGLVNTALKNNLEKFNTIITTSANSNIAKTALVPTIYKDKVNKNAVDSVSDDLVLTQLITSENDTDDLTYRNIVEIVKTSNMVGRKNEYSVVGNQNPEEEPQEIDSDRAEIVRILPPFGDTGIYYIIAIVTIAAIGIIVGGVIFIKKKILRK